MDRRKALAVAAALTMSVTSGVVAIGANFGAFGLGSAAPAAVTQIVSPAAATSSAQASNSSTPSREHDDSARATELSAARAEQTKGQSND